MQDIEATVLNLVAEDLCVDPSRVTREARFVENLGADSLETVELIMRFEEEFEISIPDEDAEKITTVGEAIEYIEKQRGS